MSAPTVAELAAVIGRKGMWRPDGTDAMQFPVRVLDAGFKHGRTHYKIGLIGGTGERWVWAERVTLTSEMEA